jgi:hypothetical protein
LWRGNFEKKKGGNLVAWDTVQKPKAKGGLGVINLRLQMMPCCSSTSINFITEKQCPGLSWFGSNTIRTEFLM